jgi:hypothetical protein
VPIGDSGHCRGGLRHRREPARAERRQDARPQIGRVWRAGEGRGTPSTSARI